ncbi:hypothetical protein AAG570_013883 [Ranatra chinensis]|uniref:Transposase n=1 Tax=Ranatra chinensis TaxID=642074 RepID=A0ABD0YDH3_9HEMI
MVINRNRLGPTNSEQEAKEHVAKSEAADKYPVSETLALLEIANFSMPDTARPHSTRVTQDLFVSFGWDIFTHPSYFPDLAPSDFHLFTKLEEFLDSRKFISGREELSEDFLSGGEGLLGPWGCDPPNWRKLQGRILRFHVTCGTLAPALSRQVFPHLQTSGATAAP